MTKAAEVNKPGDVNPYKMFGTDADLEQNGIVLNYSDVFWLRVARAGGSNERYKRVLTDKTRLYRRAIQTDTLLPHVAERIMREAAAEGLVLDWGSAKFGPGKMPAPDGTAMDFSVENVCKFFELLPDVFVDVQEQTGKAGLFRQAEIEEDAKN